MSLNRIQKLLFSEYSDFEDMVLVESPFAETTREGRGIRQVQIGLTPSKLVLATDIIKHACDYPVAFFSGCIDAEIESLELISIFPIELVSLSVFRRRRRKVLKAKFHDGNPSHNSKILYFELGGSDKRKMFWNLWCERVRFLSPEEKPGSSFTETSVASSTSGSSLHVIKTRVSKDKIWQYYSGNHSNNSSKKSLRWTEKDLFFGDKLELISYKMEPSPLTGYLENEVDEVRTLYRRQRFQTSGSSLSSEPSKDGCATVPGAKKVEHINRFGEGIHEGCNTGLYLSAVSYSRTSFPAQSPDSHLAMFRPEYSAPAFSRLCDEAVEAWEASSAVCKNKRHPRYYGLTTMSDLCFGLGLFLSGRGDSFSLRVKKSASLVFLSGDSVSEPEFEKPTKKLHLCNSSSHESIRPWSAQHVLEQQPLYFWTTDFWYRGSGLKRIYKGNRKYLKELEWRRREKESRHNLGLPRKMRLMAFGKKSGKNGKVGTCRLEHEEPLSEFKKKLHLESAVSVWDVDSTALALQLTAIDASLFLKIPIDELRLILVHKNANSSLNFMTWIVFSHRISSLVATNILNTHDLKYRARLVSRFINAAEKCHLLRNFQSCKSILNGLQSPAVYRLGATWKQVRHNHATKYQIFEKLSRIYRDPRVTAFLKSFSKLSLQQPYLPSALHILAALLGHAPSMSPLPDPASETPSTCAPFSLSANVFKVTDSPSPPAPPTDSHRLRNGVRKGSVPKLLDQIFSHLKTCHSRGQSSAKNGVGNNDLEIDEDGSLTPSILLHLDAPSPEEMVKTNMKIFLEHFNLGQVNPGLEEAENIMKKGQKAARKYDFTENVKAKDFLLKTPYQEKRECYFASLKIEPD